MKKILFVVALAISTATFAQKEEIKTLKKLDNLSGQPTQKDMEKMTTALAALDSQVDALTDDEKVLYHYFKVSQPIMDVMMVAMKNPNDMAAIQQASAKYNTPESLEAIAGHYNSLVDIEKKLGKKEYSEDIKPLMDMMKNQLSQAAFQLNSDKKYKEASNSFYALYKFDKTNGSYLENAAILAVQSEDYKLAEKMYDELKASDYLNNGVIYYAKSIASDNEETFPNRDARVKAIAMKTHEKPRDEKVSLKKPEVFKMLAMVSSLNGNNEKAKKNIDEALGLSPNNTEIKAEALRIYFNEGYELLKNDQKLVDEINANRADSDKYDELLAKRKEIFQQALPNFEKAYSIDSKDANTKTLLKMTYEVLGMNDKAATIK